MELSLSVSESTMDNVVYTSLFFSSLVLLLSLLLKLNSHGGGRGADGRLPPGPWKLPVIGSLHHLLGPLPHRSLAALSKRYGPVMLLKLGEVSTLVVSSPAAAAEIMKAHDLSFASRPLLLAFKILSYGGQSLTFLPYGPQWRELRKMCITELLSAKRVKSFRSVREEEVLNLVRSIAQKSASADHAVINLSRRFLLLNNDMAARAIVGSRCKYQKEFLSVLNGALEAGGGFCLADLFPSSWLVRVLSGMSLKLQRLHRASDTIVESIIREHKEKKAATEQVEEEEDLVDVLLRVQGDGSLPFALTNECIKSVILDLFGGGSETSSIALEWAMSELMRNPRAMKRAQEEVRGIVGGRRKVTEEDINEMSYLRMVIKETLRLHPPLPLLVPRECQEAVEILGYRIPAKTRVLVNAWGLGRDPRSWDDAEEFMPERFEQKDVDFKGTSFEFIPFGAGRRMCPGVSFGLAGVELPLACLLYHFDWELPAVNDGSKPQELDMTEAFLLACRRRSELRLRAIPRIPCPIP